MAGDRRLCGFPLAARNAGFAKDDTEKANPDITAVRIGYRKDGIASHHELVTTSGIGTAPPKAPQGADEFSTFERAPRRHQLALRTAIFWLPIGGTERPRATRTRIHSSMVSTSSWRHSSSERPVAMTPLRPGTRAQNDPSSSRRYFACWSAQSTYREIIENQSSATGTWRRMRRQER